MSSGSVSAAFSRGFAGIRRGQDQDGISWAMGSLQGRDHPLLCPAASCSLTAGMLSHSPVLFPQEKQIHPLGVVPRAALCRRAVSAGSSCIPARSHLPGCWPGATCLQSSARKEPPVNHLINWDIGIH